MDESLLQIGPNVWLYPADPNSDAAQPNIGIVVTSAGTVLIDAGNGPRATRRIRLALDQIQAPPVVYMLYTHHHWEHVFGAQTFQAPAVAHTMCRTLLVESAEHPWSPATIEDDIRRSPALGPVYEPMLRAIDDWPNLHIVLPSLTFSEGLTLYIGNTALRLEHIGGPHAPDSILVRIPAAGITFIGDCLQPPLHHSDVLPDRAIIVRLLDDETTQVYVDGHTRTLLSRAALTTRLDGG